MASREEILANFQACTGIEDVEAAIVQLENSGWSLMDAVNKIIPSAVHPIELDDEPDVVAVYPSSSRRNVSVAEDLFSSSSSSSRTRLLEFNIQYKDHLFHLQVPDSEDILTLKNLIQNETGIPPCSQNLRGLQGKYMGALTDRRKLHELYLPKENVLSLESGFLFHENGTSGVNYNDEDSSDYKLQVKDTTTDTTYTLYLRPTQSVLDVKINTATLTNIPVSRQSWIGWPSHISDELRLAQIGISKQHLLWVSSSSSSSHNKNVESRSDASMAFSDSDEDYVDATEIEDDYFLNDNKSGLSQPMLPDDYGDESMAGIKFGEEFSNRYGASSSSSSSVVPKFFPGSLKDAIGASCMKPAKDRKMLAIYLHHDSSVLANVFCTQVLCTESIVQFLDVNFITFGWDLTHTSNQNRALAMIGREFGSVAASTVRNIDIERLPLLALVYRLRGTTEIFQMIHGSVILDELMSQLISAHETYTSQLVIEIREEEERAARLAVKAEQDLAFEMSLMADREKQAQKEREEAERMHQEKLEEVIRQSAEEARLHEEQRKEIHRQLILQRLPDEPSESSISTQCISQLRFRTPSGDNIERRFLAESPLQVVLDFLTVKGFLTSEYKVLSSWPRRDLTTMDMNLTLKELSLYPQETLTLEEK